MTMICSPQHARCGMIGATIYVPQVPLQYASALHVQTAVVHGASEDAMTISHSLLGAG